MITDKIRPHHLERKALLYVRQSSAHQVLHNRESSALQYAMRDRLTALGWSEIEVIDDDLGRSAAGGVQRAGFERMVAEVCLGKVGAVCAREVSRFARNSRDWQQLIEMCRVVDTVLVDQETIYAPRHGNDRLRRAASTNTSSTFYASARCPPATRRRAEGSLSSARRWAS
jgi:DNA invertase Pin-like site-specific DNA recombinase